MTDRLTRAIVERLGRHFDMPSWRVELKLRDDELWLEEQIELDRAEHYERGRLDERWAQDDDSC